MRIALKRALLLAVYEAYAHAARRFSSACRRECCTCCTHNVLATTLEVDLVVDHMERSGLSALQEKVLQGTTGRRLQPALSINALADCCLQRKEPPDETENFDMVPCPLREQDGCAVYEVRPLACRVLWSVELCEERGEAVMAPALLSLNGVFQQIVEELDVGGLYGNMMDLFRPLNDRATRDAYREGQALKPAPPLLETRPNPGFLVLPEHRSGIMSALNALWETTVEGLPFREARARLRN